MQLCAWTVGNSSRRPPAAHRGCWLRLAGRGCAHPLPLECPRAVLFVSSRFPLSLSPLAPLAHSIWLVTLRSPRILRPEPVALPRVTRLSLSPAPLLQPPSMSSSAHEQQQLIGASSTFDHDAETGLADAVPRAHEAESGSLLFAASLHALKTHAADSKPSARYEPLHVASALASDDDEPRSGHFTLYPQRWLMLGLFCALSCSNAMEWLTFAPITEIATVRNREVIFARRHARVRGFQSLTLSRLVFALSATISFSSACLCSR